MRNDELIHFLWKVAYDLVANREYVVVHVGGHHDAWPEDGIFAAPPEIHLARNIGRKYEYIRLIAIDYIWPTVLEREMREAEESLERFRQEMNGSQAKGLNLYVFRDIPDEEIVARFAPARDGRSGKRAMMNHAYFAASPMETGFAERLRIVGLPGDYFAKRFREPNGIPTETLIAEIGEIERRREQEVERIFRVGKPFWSYVLLAVNLLMFLWLTLQGGSENTETLIRYGAKYNPLILEGEWWRFLTPVFLHIGFAHLLFNSFALYALGAVVERIYGSFRFLVIYFLSGVSGNVASFLFTPNISAGASGAIFGCFGALLYFGTQHRNLFSRTMGKDLWLMLAVNLAIGFIYPGIDNYAHLGGLGGGFLAAGALALPHARPRWWKRFAFAAAVILLILGSAYCGLQTGKEKPEYLLHQADIYLRQEKYGEAEKLLREALAKGIDEAKVHFQLSVALLQQNKLEEGKKELLRTIEKNPRIPEAYYNLAILYAAEGKNEDAIAQLEKALRLRPDFKEASELLQQIKMQR
ncbi:rhomboid protease YqgP [Bacillaceae bacterium]